MGSPLLRSVEDECADEMKTESDLGMTLGEEGVDVSCIVLAIIAGSADIWREDVFFRPNRDVRASEGTLVVDLDFRLMGNSISSSGGAVGPVVQ